MNNSGSNDILDGFFSKPMLPYNSSNGSGAAWAGEGQKQQQASQPPRPHTPNNMSNDVVTVASTSTSSVSGGKSGASRSAGSHREHSTTARFNPYGSSETASSHTRGGGGAAHAHAHSSAVATANPTNAVAPPMYAEATTPYAYYPPQHMPQVPVSSSSANRAVPPQGAATTMARAEDAIGADRPAAGFMQGKDGMLERLMTCLGESKGMATFQLELARITAPSSPAIPVLHQVITHLEEDIENLLSLRDAFNASGAMSGVPAYHNIAADVPKNAVPASEMQPPTYPHSHPYHLPQPPPPPPPQQQQQQQPVTDAKGAPSFFGASSSSSATVGAPMYERGGMWGLPMKHENADLPDAAGSTASVERTKLHQPYHHNFDGAMTQSGQAVPYMSGGGNSAAVLYHPLADAGEDIPPGYAPSCETGHNFIDTNVSGGGRGDVAHVPCAHMADSQTVAEGEGTPKFLAFVEFKRHRVRKYECDIDITPGLYVMVDGDRGKDCGLLVQTIKTLPNGSTSFFCMDGSDINPDKIKLEKGRVLGVATTEEIDYLHQTMQKAERVALETCRKVCDDLGIEINLQDCEYQFDMEKVSFYFNSEHSIDFRPLVRELYRLFRVRIWMENTNPHVKNAMPITDGGGNNNNNNSGGGEENNDAGAPSGSYNYDSHHHHQQRGNNNADSNDRSNRNSSRGGGGGKRRGQRWSTQKNAHGAGAKK